MSKNTEERMKIYNKGKRTWPLVDDGKDVVCNPGAFIELNSPKAKQLLKSYPKDFIPSESVKDSPSFTKLKKDNQKLNKENKALSDKLEDAKGGLEKLEELEKENLELKSKLEELEKADPTSPEKDKEKAGV